MKWVIVILIAGACLAALPMPVLANGTLQWGTCPDPVALITDANAGGALVPVGSLVELWDASASSPTAITRVGQGHLTPQAGRFVVNTLSLADGSYSLQVRVYNVPDPYAPGVESCVVIVGQNGRGTDGINVQIATLQPATICYPSAEIPTGAFSPNQGGGCQVLNPLAVTLAAFSATALDDAVLVQWETTSEIDNLGFNLYRGLADGGPWTQLNPALIPSQAPGGSQGFSYEYRDTAVLPDTTYYYLLESVDLAGTTARHGPVSVFYSGAPTAVDLVSLAATSATSQGAQAVVALALGSLALAGWSQRRKARSDADPTGDTTRM